METYNQKAQKQLKYWLYQQNRTPSWYQQKAKSIQNTFNDHLPKIYHQAMTSAIKEMTKAIITGSQYTSHDPKRDLTLEQREQLVKSLAHHYRTTATVEGAATGFGGLVLSAADFPLLLSIKIKMLYEIAAIYGYDTNDYYERLYMLHVFQLAYSSPPNNQPLLKRMTHWSKAKDQLPKKLDDFAWQRFQQDYRDYMDIAKLLQILPGVGALFGAAANHHLVDQLTTTAIFAYRMRYFEKSID